ncbi:MAG: PqqD family peptide modification chaperone [Actinomycetota bacterium]
MTSEPHHEETLVLSGMRADEIDGSFVPRPAEDARWVEIEGECVLLVEGTAETHLLNPIGSVVWQCFDGTATIQEIAEDLSAAFGVELDVVRESVLELARAVGRAGLLDGIAMEFPEPHQHVPGGIERGTQFPSFRLPGLAGEEVTLEELTSQGQVLLVNWSPACGFCAQIAPELAEMKPGLVAQGIEIVLLAYGKGEENRALLIEHGLDCVTLLHGGTQVEPYTGQGTPAAYLLDGEGRVASHLALGARAVPALARSLLGESAGSRSEV